MPPHRGSRSAVVATAIAACLSAPTAAWAQPAGPASDGLLRQMQACLAQPVPELPCVIVDRARGFVVIKDHAPSKPDAYLIVPDTEITGIEDPRALRPPVRDFWAWGWEVGEALLGRPRQDLALAINSEAGRSQNLLHIHISCVLPAVRDALAAGEVGARWASGPYVFFGDSRYNARVVETLSPDPFARLRELPAARADMGAQSLAMIGRADGGFYLLADATTPGHPAEAEELLDESCDRARALR